ncbi:uncharacterized protein LOC121834030 [Ixodes scapularis]|uniref:uncharacterized protein LOC121834030 n=1 Tax=Ixodes scapularis TaxID=6945 RepID=UPI001C38882C|nr:uncharacterized protein LOC121834030 [Ixodes scapularis]
MASGEVRKHCSQKTMKRNTTPELLGRPKQAPQDVTHLLQENLGIVDSVEEYNRMQARCHYMCMRTQDCVGEPAPSQQQGTPQHSATCCHHILWCQSYAHSLPSSFHKNVEAQFLLHRITSQATKYLHVVSSLPAEVADELEDVLAAAPTSNQYDNLKAAILARKTTSERSCLQHLLNMKELGNQRPSRLLRRNYGSSQFGDLNGKSKSGCREPTTADRSSACTNNSADKLDKLPFNINVDGHVDGRQYADKSDLVGPPS